ncbi:MAG: hypothetical protein IPJ81_12115 [Chitinophagaceae bacterium]|nr:hypothetical protein [Chitinophagaceae bacterium]
MKYNFFLNDAEHNMIKLMQQGCQNTFGELYDRYAPVILGMITKIVDNEKIADELLQKYFVKMW